MRQSVIISVENSDIKTNGWVKQYGDQIHFCSVEYAARRTPHIAYRMGFVDVIVDQKTREGILGIWDWRLQGNNKYYTVPLPGDVCDILYDLYKRLCTSGESKIARTFSFTVELPYCKNEHLYKSPLQILHHS